MSIFTLLDSLLHRYRARPRCDLAAAIITQVDLTVTLATALGATTQMRTQIGLAGEMSQALARPVSIHTHQQHEVHVS